jgi:phage terminase large subunit
LFLLQDFTVTHNTYSITQLLCIIAYLQRYDNKEISITSKTLPHIKKGVLRDFKKIMLDLKLWNDNKFNKSDLIYHFNNTTFIEFFSVDNSEKMRGPGRDILFINEANLLNYDEWTQLILRTKEKSFIDYNPVDEFCFIYDKIIPRADCKFIQSCYLDNYDFLPPEQIEEIERLQVDDETYWQIFGLGNVAKAVNLIYTRFQYNDSFPSGETIYGLDFGYNNPTALVQIVYKDTDLYLKGLLYETKLTNADLIQQLEKLIVNKHDYIYCDSAEPQRIEELYRAGFNVFPADKNVKAGIDFMKRFNLNINSSDIELVREFRSYKWKQDKNGNVLDEPVKFNDHYVDAARYGIFTHGQQYWGNKTMAFANINLEKFERTSKYEDY